jgi:hypothetical protein
MHHADNLNSAGNLAVQNKVPAHDGIPEFLREVRARCSHAGMLRETFANEVDLAPVGCANSA